MPLRTAIEEISFCVCVRFVTMLSSFLRSHRNCDNICRTFIVVIITFYFILSSILWLENFIQVYARLSAIYRHCENNRFRPAYQAERSEKILCGNHQDFGPLHEFPGVALRNPLLLGNQKSHCPLDPGSLSNRFL